MSPIVYELGLVIVAVVGFAVWQSVTLKRDMRITRERAEREAMRGEGAPLSDASSEPTADPPRAAGDRR